MAEENPFRNADNPFLHLLKGVDDVAKLQEFFEEEMDQSPKSVYEDKNRFVQPPKRKKVSDSSAISRCLESVFLMTVSNKLPASQPARYPHQVLFLPNLSMQMAVCEEPLLLSLDNIDQALFERHKLSVDSSSLVKNNSGLRGPLCKEHDVTEMQSVMYFGASFERAIKYASAVPELSELCTACQQLSVSYVAVDARRDLALAPGNHKTSQAISELLFLNCKGTANVTLSFLSALVNELSPGEAKALFKPGLESLLSVTPKPEDFLNQSVHSFICTIAFYARHPALAELLTLCSKWLPQYEAGKEYEKSTLLGQLLALSPMPALPTSMSTVFSTFDGQTEDMLSNQVDICREEIGKIVHGVTDVVKSLLRHSGTPRTRVFQWVCSCFASNKSRGQMGLEFQSAMARALHLATSGGDAFFLNLLWLMLRVAAPIVKEGLSQASRVDPLYSRAVVLPQQDWERFGGPVLGLTEEPRLVPAEDGSRVTAPEPSLPFNFATHWFHLTIRCLALSLPAASKTYLQLRDPVQRAIGKGALSQLAMAAPDMPEVRQLKLGLSQYYSSKAHLCHPKLLQDVILFQGLVCDWILSQILLGSSGSGGGSVGSKDVVVDYSFLNASLCSYVREMRTPAAFHHIAEGTVESVIEMLLLCDKLGGCTAAALAPVNLKIGTASSVLVGWKHFVRNPHLRARFIEILSLLLAKEKDEEEDSDSLPLAIFSQQQDRILPKFYDHLFVQNIFIESLLKIFIDIEMSGEDLHFEQKYRYRHQIYSVVMNVWQRAEYQSTVKVLSEEAVSRYMEPTLPLFLKFINLLVNDAVALLDRALNALSLVREKERFEESEEWSQLSQQQKEGKEEELKFAISDSKETNQMAFRAVAVVCLVADTTSKPLVIVTMVDRVAAMLNYFLVKLVGPKRNELKVKDFHRVSFDAKDLLHSISLIYVSLSQHEAFCRAVCNDERSYSLPLLEEAHRTLAMLNAPLSTVIAFRSFIADVASVEEAQKAELKLAEIAPSSYCDQLMGSLMTDPVRLPSSNAVMDRTNILRHLMSDATDPFTRQPLTADQLEPDLELQQKILEWKRDQLSGDQPCSETNSSNTIDVQNENDNDDDLY